jgi:sugar phosphate permease
LAFRWTGLAFAVEETLVAAGDFQGDPDSAPQQFLGERPTWVRWRVAAVLMGYSFMTWFNRVSMTTAGGRMIKSEVLSETQMGTVYSAFLFLYTLFMTPGGWFSDRFGPRRALMLMGFGSALLGACTGVVGLVELSPTLLLASFWVVRGLMGMFTAPIYPSSGRLVSHWVPLATRAGANGLVQGAAAVGIAFTYFVFGWMSDHWGWPKSFLITGAVTASLAVLLTVYVTDRPSQHAGTNEAERRMIAPGGEAGEFSRPDEPSGAAGVAAHDRASGSRVTTGGAWDWLALLRNRSLVCLTFSYAAVGYFEYLFFFWMDFYFGEVLHLGETQSRIYAMFPPLAMAVGMPLGGWLSDAVGLRYGRRLGRALVPAGGMLLSAALLFAGVIAVQMKAAPVWIVTWFSLALGAIGAVEGPTWSTAIELGRRHGSTAAGICNTGGNAGGTLAPTITPWVGVNFGWSYAMLIGCVVCLAGVVLWFWVDPEEGER